MFVLWVFVSLVVHQQVPSGQPDPGGAFVVISLRSQSSAVRFDGLSSDQ